MRAVARIVAAIAFFGALAVGAALVWFVANVRDTRYPAASTDVVIPSGATGRDIAALLQREGVIASQPAFEILARVRGERAAMKAGEYRFAPHRSMQDVLDQVVSGSALAVWVTIPEGFTAREIARTLAADSLGPERDFDATFFGRSLDIDGTRTANLEGFLFPQTYLIAKSASPAEIAAQMTREFARELPPDAEALARKLGLSVPQVVTVASIVEREAGVDDERALMAGVYYNRLRRRMPLQVDATIEYTFARHHPTITYADLASRSPYNTYAHLGLPPTPIANPGRASLDAAFHPRPSSYLYYVAMGNGHSAFSRTLAEHDAAVARYLK
jgi:UPF0755 protein